MVHAFRFRFASTTVFSFPLSCCRSFAFPFDQMSVITSDQFKLKHHKSIYSLSNAGSGKAALATLRTASPIANIQYVFKNIAYLHSTMPWNVRSERSFHVIAEQKSSFCVWERARERTLQCSASISFIRVVCPCDGLYFSRLRTTLLFSTCYPQSTVPTQHMYSAFDDDQSSQSW